MDTLNALMRAGSWFTKYIPGYFLSRYYTEERMQSLISIDVPPRGGHIIFDFDEPETTEVRLRIYNFSPFLITIDYIKVEIWGIGKTLTLAAKLMKLMLATGWAPRRPYSICSTFRSPSAGSPKMLQNFKFCTAASTSVAVSPAVSTQEDGKTKSPFFLADCC